MQAVLHAIDVYKEYIDDQHRVKALDGLSLSIDEGAFVAVMGASGSGKSTFMHLAGGLDTPSSGQILIEAQNLAEMNDYERTLFRREKLGIVFQQFNLIPGLSAMENICLPLLIDGISYAQAEIQARTLLDIVDLADRSNHRPQALSGGEQQRVAIARALINDPAVVLADEPTGNLDSHHAAEIWALLRRLANDHRKTIVMVTHDAKGAAFANRVCVLRDGKLLGEIESEGNGEAAVVAHRYQELVG